MVQFWQCLQHIVQPIVKIVPEGTSSGSSPICSKILETTISFPHLQYPSSPVLLFAPQLCAQKLQPRRILLAISTLRSKYDFCGNGNSSRHLCPLSICLSSS